MFTIVSAPISGWLADAKFGNYKVFRVGVVLMFMSAVINCFFLILEAMVLRSDYVLERIQLLAVGSLFAVSFFACMVTAMPLGLDQMPDASSSSITSFIAWFVFTFFISMFFNKLIKSINNLSFISERNLYLIYAIFSTFLMSVVWISTFVCSPKWLIIEPKSSQSLKTIYQVLKFAAKHKSPLNRSAFTYWEEDIPSRMDLGKSKYGGPFTTEQVENVKTILRLIAISSPLFFVVLPSNFNSYRPALFGESIRKSVVYSFTIKMLYCSTTYAIVTTLAFEFLIYPFAKNKFPGILRRIAAVPLIYSIVSFICLILELTNYLTDFSEGATK